MFKAFYLKVIAFGNSIQSLLLLVMRLFWGYQFFKSGWGKLQDIPSVAGFFESLSIPFPVFNAYLVGYVEAVGGLCLILGLGARLFAIPLVINMVVALFTAHLGDLKKTWEDSNNLLRSTPFTFLLTSLVVLAFGPGKYSLDYLLEKFFKPDSTQQ